VSLPPMRSVDHRFALVPWLTRKNGGGPEGSAVATGYIRPGAAIHTGHFHVLPRSPHQI